MGTRSTVKFYTESGKNILSLYNQYDGYYEGVGAELVEFFSNPKNYGNGFEDTALLYVCWKKKGNAYNTYITDEYDLQEYNYEIHLDKDTHKPVFSISREVFGKYDKMQTLDYDYGYVWVLRWATLEDFADFINGKYENE